ncbi:hypothetical protein CICLE_v10017417mg [Citrus x clementina]|uniref:Uncharacterized protein n=1 Tax=Citrus clementina TaxID=85681 RepID=V4TLD7_CITCL|nr:hypothetical protein CICLE_v10017417mg [Citrus x clementina]
MKNATSNLKKLVKKIQVMHGNENQFHITFFCLFFQSSIYIYILDRKQIFNLLSNKSKKIYSSFSNKT